MQFMERHRLLRGMFKQQIRLRFRRFFEAVMSNHKEIALIRSHTARFASYRVEIGFKLPPGWD